jgi:hypothetical protein
MSPWYKPTFEIITKCQIIELSRVDSTDILLKTLKKILKNIFDMQLKCSQTTKLN